MSYFRVAVLPSHASRREAISAALFAAGAEGILEDGPRLVTVFADEPVAAVAAGAAQSADDAARVTTEAIDPGDWTEAWRAGVGAHEIDALVIAPPWLAGEFPAERTIVIEPGMGFGTGEHESTRITMALLQGVLRAGDNVVDAGCGSGVLAIAAAKLGASHVTAIEIDPQAIHNAEENIARNGVAERVSVIEGDATSLLPLLAPVRIVMANIIATVLLEFLPSIGVALAGEGTLIVGGILRAERDGFVRDAGLRGWTLRSEQNEGAWWGGVLTARDE